MKIANKAEVDRFIDEQMSIPNNRIASVKGSPPKGAKYNDGTPIISLVNVAWISPVTHARVDIEYTLEDQDG